MSEVQHFRFVCVAAALMLPHTAVEGVPHPIAIRYKRAIALTLQPREVFQEHGERSP